MSQISPPVRILLIGAVVFLAAWFTILRPKPVEVPPVTTTTTTTTTTPATKSKTEKATTSAPHVKPAEAAVPAIPAAVLAKLPKDVAQALETRKVLVLGVLADDTKPWRSLADDDRSVRKALKGVNRYDGRVFVKSVPLRKLSGYGSLVNDLGVNQTPSVVVIDRNLKGQVITGYADTLSINQVIADARRDSIEPDIKDPYLRHANALCGRFETRYTRWSLPTVRGQKPLTAAYERAQTLTRSYRRQIARTPAPAKYRSLKAQWLKAMDSDLARIAKLIKTSKTKTVIDDVAVDFDTSAKIWRQLDRRFDDAGLTDCAENRRS